MCSSQRAGLQNICTCSSSDDENHCENVCKDADNKDDENVDAAM